MPRFAASVRIRGDVIIEAETLKQARQILADVHPMLGTKAIINAEKTFKVVSLPEPDDFGRKDEDPPSTDDIVLQPHNVKHNVVDIMPGR